MGSEAFDAHIQVANKMFRSAGFTLAAMQYPRPPKALAGLKRFNGVPDDMPVPLAWHYFPNAYMRDNWSRYYA